MRCPDCAAEVSPLREFCPQCGSPTDPGVRNRLRSGTGDRPPEDFKRNRKTVVLVGAGLLIAMGVLGRTLSFGHISIPREPISINHPVVTNEAVTITAPELFEAYHRDSDAANRRFGGRQMVVTGEFVRTVPDGYGSIDMRLKTNHPDLPLGIDLDNHSVDAATKLEPGETVTVSCRRVAGSGDDPWLEDCVLQPPALPGIEAGAAPPPGGPPPPSPPPPPQG